MHLITSIKSKINILVFILDGNWAIVAHVQNDLGYLIRKAYVKIASSHRYDFFKDRFSFMGAQRVLRYL